MTEQNAEPTLQQIATRLNPTKAFYISHEKDFTDVIDLTGQLGILYSLELGISEVSLRTAQTIANGQPRLPNAYSVEPDNFLDTRHTLRNYKGEDVGGMKKKVLSFAKATLSFLAQGEGEASPVEVRPVGAKNKVQEFRIDGIKYRCEVEKGRNEVKRFDRVFFKVCKSRSCGLVYAKFAECIRRKSGEWRRWEGILRLTNIRSGGCCCLMRGSWMRRLRF